MQIFPSKAALSSDARRIRTYGDSGLVLPPPTNCTSPDEYRSGEITAHHQRVTFTRGPVHRAGTTSPDAGAGPFPMVTCLPKVLVPDLNVVGRTPERLVVRENQTVANPPRRKVSDSTQEHSGFGASGFLSPLDRQLTREFARCSLNVCAAGAVVVAAGEYLVPAANSVVLKVVLG